MFAEQVFDTVGTASITFPSDAVIDLLLVGGGAGGTNSTGGGSGAVIFYKGYFIAAGTYSFTVGACGSGYNVSGSDTSISSLFVARGGSASTGASGMVNNVVAGLNVTGANVVEYSYATFGGYAGQPWNNCTGTSNKACQPGGGGGAGGNCTNATSSTAAGLGGPAVASAKLKVCAACMTPIQ